MHRIPSISIYLSPAQRCLQAVQCRAVESPVSEMESTQHCRQDQRASRESLSLAESSACACLPAEQPARRRCRLRANGSMALGTGSSRRSAYLRRRAAHAAALQFVTTGYHNRQREQRVLQDSPVARRAASATTGSFSPAVLLLPARVSHTNAQTRSRTASADGTDARTDGIARKGERADALSLSGSVQPTGGWTAAKKCGRLLIR